MKKITFVISILYISFFSTAFIDAAEVQGALSPVQSASVSVATSTPAQPPAPVSSTSENVYNYNPLGKPDPFKPFIEVELATKAKAEVKKDVNISSIFPLQRVEVEKFRLVGIAGDEIRRVAVVEDAAKKFYPLFIGTHIGVNKGKVLEILADRVIVEEYETNKAKRIILKLRKN
jgi:type IV pilus assembly protein PilP